MSLPNPYAVLTDKQLQILTAVAKGHTTKNIATSLCIASRTIDNHLLRIYTKLSMPVSNNINKRFLAVYLLNFYNTSFPSYIS
jgi:DNA-binding NarL/FixJ family response regulator